jgi:hypothetical protein
MANEGGTERSEGLWGGERMGWVEGRVGERPTGCRLDYGGDRLRGGRVV